MNGTVLLWCGLLAAVAEVAGLWMNHLARTKYVEIHEGIIRAFRAPSWKRRTATALIVAGPVLALIGAALALVIGSWPQPTLGMCGPADSSELCTDP